MPTLDVVDKLNVKVGETEIAKVFLQETPNQAVIYQVAVAQRAAGHRGTHKTKTRGEVAGSTAKPWRQKGTGRARAGSRKSPVWGNSTVFGPTPRSYRKKVPKKVRRIALRSALKFKFDASAIRILDDFDLTTPKTKEGRVLLDALGLEGKVLAVTSGDERNFVLALRNLPTVELRHASNVDLISVLTADHLLFSRSSLESFARLNHHE